LTGAALTGLFTLAGSALAGGLAYLQGHASRQTERLKQLADARASLRQERKDAYLRVLTVTPQAQDAFVQLQADENWAGLPEAQRLAEVRKVRHVVQEAVFAAFLVAREDTDTMGALAYLNAHIFEAGDQLVADPTSVPEAVDVGPILIALKQDLSDLPD
jgi:hypothetical protein